MGTILLFVFEHAVYTSFAINLKNSFHCAVNDYAKDHSCERVTLLVTHKHFSVLCQGLVIILFVCLFLSLSALSGKLLGKPQSTSETVAGSPDGIQTGLFLYINSEVTNLLANILQ
jgi:hypothetical protein